MKITIKQLKQLIKEQVEESSLKAPMDANSTLGLIDNLLYEAYNQGRSDGRIDAESEYGESTGMELGEDRTRMEQTIKDLFAELDKLKEQVSSAGLVTGGRSKKDQDKDFEPREWEEEWRKTGVLPPHLK